MGPAMLPILAGVLGLVVIGGVAAVFAGGGQGRTVRRAQAIAERNRGGLGRVRSNAPDPGQRRKQILQSLREDERRHRKVSFSIGARLQQAGLNISAQTFWMISGGLGLAAFAAILLLRQGVPIALGFAIAAGGGLPRWALTFLAKRRAKKFVESFADATDIIVRGIKSGLPVHECLQVISRECPEPLASEFRRLVDGVAHGVPLDQALEMMHARIPLPELRFFTIVLGIQQKTGGNLAEALGNLSSVLRSRRMMREKVKALSSEATASAAIIGCLPPAVIIMLSMTAPTYLSILVTDPRGHLIIAAAVVWMSVGVFIMNRMVNFKI
jgi:tight adherence protein B